MSTFTPLNSSYIAKISYNDGTIYVLFKNGFNCAYSATEELYNEFISAESVGKFWNKHLKIKKQ